MQEQKSEVEVLESIFLNDFQYVQAKYPYKFTINCRPFFDEPLSEDKELDLKLVFEMSQNYPNDELSCHLVPNGKLSPQQLQQIYDEIFVYCQENKGYPVVYQIVEQIRVSLINQNYIQRELVDDTTTLNYFGLRDDSENSDMEDDYMMQLKKEKQQRLNFTPCTPEAFMLWNNKFLAEMAEKKQETFKDTLKITGRQYFEQNINMPMMDSDESGDDYDLEGDQSEFFN